MKKVLLSMAAIPVLLTGCGSDSSDSDNNGNTGDGVPAASFSSLKVNAVSRENWAYVNLDRGEMVALTSEQASSSGDWHLAFRRHTIRSNGGASGSGNVQVAVVDGQDEFYSDGQPVDNTFLNAAAGQYEADLVKDFDISALTFAQDANKPAIKGEDWYSYNQETHTLSANTSNVWLVRHADSKTYSKFSFSSLTPQPDRTYSVELKFETQAADTSQFAGGEQTLTAAMSPGQALLCLDLDSKAKVDCDSESANWDLRLEISRSGTGLWTNGGVFGDGSGAVFGPQTKEAAAAMTSATSIAGNDISSHYSADRAESVFDSSSWYAYNLSGQHRLLPNYRTYLIDTDKTSDNSEKYTLQVINYYGLGESGTPEIRFKKVAAK